MVQNITINKVRSTVEIDASGISTSEVNARLRELVSNGIENIDILNVCGQRYIGTDLKKSVSIEIFGTPGNDLGSFMDGPKLSFMAMLKMAVATP